MHKLLADILERVYKISENNIVQSKLIARMDRERLLKAGLMQEIIRGWYILIDPTKNEGESMIWYASYWNFVQVYLNQRLGPDYCLSAECSLDVWAESENLLPQLVVMTSRSSTSMIKLPFNGSILIYHDKKNLPETVVKKWGLRIMPLETALVWASPRYFEKFPLNAELLLRQVSVSAISRELLKKGAVSAAVRIASLYAKYGLEKESQEIIENMEAAGFVVKVDHEQLDMDNSFLGKGEKVQSAYSGRIKALWYEFRKEVIAYFNVQPVGVLNEKELLLSLEDIYVNDAYNSLSIEGYTVTPQLIEKIRNGDWDPSKYPDSRQRDLLAAKGYKNAFESVKDSIKKVFSGTDVARVVEEDLQKWYRELFSPFVRLGVVAPEGLAGYRNHPVFIKNSKHVPARSEIVPELMETYFGLLKDETDERVRVVLGHFFFVYIHPYMDGNGRLGRFIMNLFLVFEGYPWTVIEVNRRREYMESLERASVEHNIIPFTQFICSEIV